MNLIRKPFLIYDFNCSTLNFLIYEENLIFFFISAPWARGNEDKRLKKMEVKDIRDPCEQRTKNQRKFHTWMRS
jgi:hypothetical protein